MGKRNVLIVLSILLVYGVSTTLSYAFFSKSSALSNIATSPVPKPTPKTGKKAKTMFDPTLPQTEACPLNGALYSKQQRAWWEKHRPLGIMIENHQEARPQSGLSFADVIYEAVAEGGITRFLAMYYCQDADPVGPIRSARVYFLSFVSEYGDFPLYAHVGGANMPGPADALSQISQLGWMAYNDLNQFSIGFPTFWRDYDRLGRTTDTEHTMYSTTTKLWNFAAKSRELTNVDEDGGQWNEKFVPYTFKEDIPLSQRPTKQNVHITFWERYTQYAVDWAYEREANLYKRSHKGSAHIDLDTDEQLTAKTVVVLFVQESNANDGYENNAHLLYKTQGTGKAIVFMDGKRTDGTWRKESKTARTILFDNVGSPIQFNKGTLWFSIVPTTGIVTVQ